MFSKQVILSLKTFPISLLICPACYICDKIKCCTNNFYTSQVFIRCSYVQSTQHICCKHLIWHDISADQIPRMTLYSFRSCKVSPPSEFLNVIATQINGQMILNTVSSCKASLHCELSYVFVNLQLGKMTLNSVCRCVVSHQYELLNVAPSFL